MESGGAIGGYFRKDCGKAHLDNRKMATITHGLAGAIDGNI